MAQTISTKTIDLRPFPYEIKIVVTNNIGDYEKKVRGEHNDPTPNIVDGSTGGLTMSAAGMRTIYIIVPPGISIGVIAHEVTHAVARLLKFVGAKPDSELVAYYTGWLVEEIAKFVYAKTNRKNKLTKTKVV